MVTVENSTYDKLPAYYYDYYSVRESDSIGSVGIVGTAWGRNVDKGVLKRVSPSVEMLRINSTIENTTLPYFKVHSICWIENRDSIPGIRDNVTPPDILRAHFQTTPTRVFSFPLGHAILVPNVTTNWSSDPLDSTIIHDTRLLIMWYAYDDLALPWQPGLHVAVTQDIPSTAYTELYNTTRFAFAWVSFSAGVGQCKEYTCLISSSSTIQNTTPIELEPHLLTFQALSMAPVVGVHLVMQNNSLPYLWYNVNDYIEAILVRSYSGAWNRLIWNMQTSNIYTSYVPSVPSLVADIDRTRVYIWLGIQLLVTLLSTLFLIVHSFLSKFSHLGETTLVAFYLDTTEIPGEWNATESKEREFLKIEPRGDRLKVKLE